MIFAESDPRAHVAAAAQVHYNMDLEPRPTMAYRQKTPSETVGILSNGNVRLDVRRRAILQKYI